MLKLKFEGHPDFPGRARAWVMLDDHSVDQQGRALVTPSAAGAAEFDGYIDSLHADLEKIRKRGHQRFDDIKRGWKERIDARRSE